jgi:hypothetical protein
VNQPGEEALVLALQIYIISTYLEERQFVKAKMAQAKGRR